MKNNFDEYYFQDYRYNLFEKDYSYLYFDFNFYNLIFL